MKKLLIVICVLLVFSLGFLAGGFHFKPKSNINDFMSGKTNFCKLTEGERIQVCPKQRSRIVLPAGGEVVQYHCRSIKRGLIEGYIRLTDMTKKSEADFGLARMQLIQKGLSVTKICSNEREVFYRVQLGTSI